MRRSIALVLLASLLLGLIPGTVLAQSDGGTIFLPLVSGGNGVNAAAGSATELFISEYIEGSSNNKAIEIYNGTGATVDLAADGYNIQMYSNGNTTASVTINLTGSVAAGDVFVVAQASANATILAQADQTNGSGWFNGDDAVVLRKGTTNLDVIGQIGFDPGTEWGTGLVSTADNTLRRKASICAGDPDGGNAFDPSLEWEGFATDTFDGLGAHAASCGAATEPKINEFSASTVGADVEYVEIFGPANTDLAAYKVLEIEGDAGNSAGNSAGTVDEVISLGTTDAGGFYLASLPANALENGTLTLLLVKNFTGALNTDLDANDDGVFDTTPWDTIVDAVAVNDGGLGDLTYGTPALGPNYDGVSSFAPGGASRIPDGLDTDSAGDWVRNDFDLAGIPGFAGTIGLGEAYNTPGASNQVYVLPPEACGDPTTPIFTVQGSGAASPLAGTDVAIEGVVVGDFQNNTAPDSGNLNGFHVQAPVGDGDPATSDGIFVYAPGSADVQVGDGVRVRGSVSEFNGMTEITLSNLWICSTGNVVAPTAVSLPVASLETLEAYEGMLVTFPQPLTISEYFNFDRFGEIVLTTDRQSTPTAVVEPGTDAVALEATQALARITLDDGRTTQNSDPAIHPNGAIFNLSNSFRGGDIVQNVTGVVDYSFGLYRIQPTRGADYTPANPRTAAPDAVGGSMKVASFNVLNYFTTLAPAGRGADTLEEFARQRAKIFAALAAIDADVVGLIEIENNTAAIQDLVDGLNTVVGAGTYAYVDTGIIGTDAIKVAFIYKPATVQPVGAYAVLDSSVDARFIDTKNRPALAQTFARTADNAAVTVVVNHLKSKGSDCNDVGDLDLGDGAGNCNLTRKAAAEALVDWLATDPTGSGDADYLIIGDLNSYDKEDPIDAILAGSDDGLGTADDYTDLVRTFQGETAYSYVFDGKTGYLDHALSGASLTPQVAGTTVWHINADEPDLIDYDMSFKQPAQDAIYAPDAYRSSDHDPVIIGLDLNAPPVCVAAAPSIATLWPVNHAMVAINVLGVTDPDGDPVAITIDSIFQDEPVNGTGDGDTAPDGAGIDTPTAQVRAERAGNGNGRVYHIGFTATDSSNNTCSGAVTVSVPKSQGKNGAAVDDGALYDSTDANSVAGSTRFAADMVERMFIPFVGR